MNLFLDRSRLHDRAQRPIRASRLRANSCVLIAEKASLLSRLKKNFIFMKIFIWKSFKCIDVKLFLKLHITASF